jgi:hypothetical protein
MMRKTLANMYLEDCEYIMCLNTKNLRKTGCGSGRFLELAQNRIQ